MTVQRAKLAGAEGVVALSAQDPFQNRRRRDEVVAEGPEGHHGPALARTRDERQLEQPAPLEPGPPRDGRGPLPRAQLARPRYSRY